MDGQLSRKFFHRHLAPFLMHRHAIAIELPSRSTTLTVADGGTILAGESLPFCVAFSQDFLPGFQRRIWISLGRIGGRWFQFGSVFADDQCIDLLLPVLDMEDQFEALLQKSLQHLVCVCLCGAFRDSCHDVVVLGVDQFRARDLGWFNLVGLFYQVSQRQICVRSTCRTDVRTKYFWIERSGRLDGGYLKCRSGRYSRSGGCYLRAHAAPRTKHCDRNCGYCTTHPENMLRSISHESPSLFQWTAIAEDPLGIK